MNHSIIASYCATHTPKQLNDALKKLELKCKKMKGGLCLLCFWKKLSRNTVFQKTIDTISNGNEIEGEVSASELLKATLDSELDQIYSKSFDRRQNTARHSKMHPELKNLDDKRVQNAWIISLKRAGKITEALRLFVCGFGGRGDIHREDFSDFLADVMIPTDIKSIEAW